MDPVRVGLLVMGISTTSVTEANRLEAAQPVLDEAHLISVEKPADKKEAPPISRSAPSLGEGLVQFPR